MSLKISIIDCGMGNLQSVYKKLKQLNAHPSISTNAGEILKADKIIFPGVGNFEKAIMNLKKSGGYEALNEAVMANKRPYLGICLGMQIMAKFSEEGNVPGLGWLDARVVKFKINNKIKFKIPQVGWNTINFLKESRLFKDIEDKSEFYFLHSYHLEGVDNKNILSNTNFEYPFISAIEKENIFGTQFHPEKSHHNGTQLIKNFIHL